MQVVCMCLCSVFVCAVHVRSLVGIESARERERERERGKVERAVIPMVTRYTHCTQGESEEFNTSLPAQVQMRLLQKLNVHRSPALLDLAAMPERGQQRGTV